MAAFVKRKGPNGRVVWQARIRRRGYPEQIPTFDSKADAQGWAGEVEAQLRRGIHVDRGVAERMLVRDALDRYLTEVSGSRRSTVSGSITRSYCGGR